MNNKQKYENPQVLIVTFEQADIVTLSGETGNGPEYDIDDLMSF